MLFLLYLCVGIFTLCRWPLNEEPGHLSRLAIPKVEFALKNCLQGLGRNDLFSSLLISLQVLAFEHVFGHMCAWYLLDHQEQSYSLEALLNLLQSDSRYHADLWLFLFLVLLLVELLVRVLRFLIFLIDICHLVVFGELAGTLAFVLDKLD